MDWLPDTDGLLWSAAMQFCIYGLGWAICALFVKFERKTVLSVSVIMLALGALLLTLSDQVAHFAWVAVLYCLIGVLLNISLLIYLLKRFEKHLIEQNRYDELTGLANRRALDRALMREWRRLQRSGTGFALLAMDLDHFKEVNDRFGHPAGDQMLIQVAGRLKRAAREVDLIARVGGEEFIVLVHGNSVEGALIAAERLRAAVSAAPYALKDGLAPITISIGIALATADDLELANVLERADQALYQAKHEGRNRVCLEAVPITGLKSIHS
jgi:diguanylate cyclase (GGDEF)-like protein